ncbi:MAG: hypothetical protein AB1Z98_32135, partial [Nannocystaceae bacterium]
MKPLGAAVWSTITMLALAGCTNDVVTTIVAVDDSTGAAMGSTGDASTAAATAESSGGDSTTGVQAPDCQEPREPPPSPFDCTGVDGVLEGSVIIDDTPESDSPEMLEGIAVVVGAIRLNGTDLTNLDFMGCVREVGADLTFFDNDLLTNVDGLHNIESIGTELVFFENGALVDFDGLPNLERVNTTLAFRSNSALETISGFHRLVEVDSEIPNCPACESWDFPGNLTIQGNSVLRNIDGLGGLRIVGNILAISNNPMLCMSSVN